MRVKIKINANYPKTSDKKWCLIVDDTTEHLVDSAEILCKSFTTTENEISCKAKSVALVTAKGIVKAKIK